MQVKGRLLDPRIVRGVGRNLEKGGQMNKVTRAKRAEIFRPETTPTIRKTALAVLVPGGSLASQTLQSQGKGGSGDFACSELCPWNSIITRYVTGNRKCSTARNAHACCSLATKSKPRI